MGKTKHQAWWLMAGGTMWSRTRGSGCWFNSITSIDIDLCYTGEYSQLNYYVINSVIERVWKTKRNIPKIIFWMFPSNKTLGLTLTLSEGKYAKLTQVDHLWPIRQVTVFIFKGAVMILLQSIDNSFLTQFKKFSFRFCHTCWHQPPTNHDEPKPLDETSW